MSVIVIAIILFIAFTIGLNLGLHGVILIQHQNYPKSNYDSHESHVSSILPVPDDITAVNSPPQARQEHIETPTKTKPQFPTTTFPKPVTPIKSILQPAIPRDKPTIPQPTSEVVAPSPLTTLQKKLHDIENNVIHQLAFKSPMKKNPFIETPIVLLTCCRPALLKETLQSLMKVRGVDSKKILIIQDGNTQDIVKIAQSHSIKVIQNTQSLGLRGSLDGGARIAQHYKFALTTAFNHFTTSNAVIVVEDDLLFSPDFYEYLVNTAMMLLEDSSSFVVSAWSDNGFANKVHDPYSLRRTEFFPGLGWLLTRKLYKTELERKWPNEHWDHWLRSPAIHQYRETIFPQVPRTYHNGVKGTFMDQSTHNRYFKDIAYNQDTSIVWTSSASTSLPAVTESSYANYQKGSYQYNEQRIQELLKVCHHLTSMEELIQLSSEIICIWISERVDIEDSRPPFYKISTFFGLWHEHKRGNHKGLHEFYFFSNYILLLNIDQSLLPPLGGRQAIQHYQQVPNFQNKYKYFTYESFKPKDIPVLSNDEFHQNYLLKIKEKQAALGLLPGAAKVNTKNIYAGTATDMSCDEVSIKDSRS